MSASPPQAPAQAGGALFLLLAAAAGAAAANLYYAQPLIALIAPDIGIGPEWSGLAVTLGQIGYIIGLLFLVPLGDLMENRRLIVLVMVVAALGLALAATAQTAFMFFAAAFLFGIGSVVAQVAVPFAAHLAAPEERGHKVGMVVSGLMAGILLARPVASFIAHLAGWHAVFVAATVLMLGLAVALRLRLPPRRPEAAASYGALVGSLWPLLRDTPLLRRRAAYQATLFGAFTLFWTAVPLLLSAPPFGYTQDGIAAFALAGAASVLFSPLAGWAADRGWSRAATLGGFAFAVLGFLLAAAGAAMGSVVLLALGAVVLDIGVATNLVIGQRALFMLDAAIRGRLNALYIAGFFFGGATGSAFASLIYEQAGWTGVTLAGVAVLMLGTLHALLRGRAATTAA
ncbi:MAG TPA: MFS transporter [Xanthobacteraceae bacterium]|nr:MFS transporter [Xanthobacteraceae bacterium]